MTEFHIRIFGDSNENHFIEKKGEGSLEIIRVIKEPTSEEFEAQYYNYVVQALYIVGDCAVTFIKADGSERTMNISRKRLEDHMEANPPVDDRYKKAAETRKKNHPNLLTVFDVDSDTVKSINMKTIQKIEYANMLVTFTETKSEENA